jgi:hypothetical protein
MITVRELVVLLVFGGLVSVGAGVAHAHLLWDRRAHASTRRSYENLKQMLVAAGWNFEKKENGVHHWICSCATCAAHLRSSKEESDASEAKKE